MRAGVVAVRVDQGGLGRDALGLGRGLGLRGRLRRLRGGLLRRLQRIDLRQHARQLALQVQLGLLVVGVGQLAQPVLELQIAEVLVDLRFAVFQVRRGRYRSGFGNILVANEQRERDRSHHQDNCDRDHH